MSNLDSNQVLNNLLASLNQPADQSEQVGGTPAPMMADSDELLEAGESFDFDGFQVVRREFFAHLNEPSISFANSKLKVNSACLSKFPQTEYVQALVNQTTKILAIRPCREGDKDSFLWCTTSNGKRKPKDVTCRLFTALITSLMDWNPDYRYKILGKLIRANGQFLIAFDLTATEVYQRIEREDGTPKMSRTPVYPASWQNQFGLPVNEHKKSLQINIFDGYAVYAIKDKKMVLVSGSESDNMEGEQHVSA